MPVRVALNKRVKDRKGVFFAKFSSFEDDNLKKRRFDAGVGDRKHAHSEGEAV